MMTNKPAPWGAVPRNAARFSVLKQEQTGASTKFVPQYAGHGNTGVREKYFAIAALSVPFVQQFGPGWYQIRFLHGENAGKATGVIRTSVAFELTGEVEEAEPAASYAPPDPATSMFDRVLHTLEQQTNAGEQRAEKLLQLVDGVRKSAFGEVLQLQGLMLQQQQAIAAQMAAAQAAKPAPSEEAPAWAKALAAKVDALEQRLNEEEEDDEEDEEDDEPTAAAGGSAEDEDTKEALSEALEDMSPAMRLVALQVFKNGGPLLGMLLQSMGQPVPPGIAAENGAPAASAPPKPEQGPMVPPAPSPS